MKSGCPPPPPPYSEDWQNLGVRLRQMAKSGCPLKSLHPAVMCFEWSLSILACHVSTYNSFIVMHFLQGLRGHNKLPTFCLTNQTVRRGPDNKCLYFFQLDIWWKVCKNTKYPPSNCHLHHFHYILLNWNTKCIVQLWFNNYKENIF